MAAAGTNARLGTRVVDSPATTDGDRDSDLDSDDDSFGSDDGTSESEDDTSDGSEGDVPALRPLQRLSKAVRDKQRRMLDARRHPTLGWKAEQRRRAEEDALAATQEIEMERRERALADKRGKRERREKRRAQRQLSKRRAREIRELLQSYEAQLAKSDTRARLLTAFAIENRAREKAAAAERQAAIRAADQEQQAQQARWTGYTSHGRRVCAAIQRHAEAADRDLAALRDSMSAADQIGRRLGTLPAIHSPAPPSLPEQDETARLVVLRVNKSRPSPLAASASAEAVTQPPPAFDASASPDKRQFFSVNLKRFKHADTVRGENVGDVGAKELARSLLTGACPRVKTLLLGWNGIKFAGTAALADCFTRGACGQLQTLDLRFNLLDSQAVRSLVEMLDKSALPELLDLLLQGNAIGDEGARLLAHAALRGAVRGLRTLDIRQNAIRNDGVRALWNVFTAESVSRCCPRLQKLDMRRNDATSALLRSFCPCPTHMQF